MNEEYVFLQQLADYGSVPGRSILTTTVYGDERVKVTLFRFAPGQELTAHTAAHPVLLQFLSGEAELRLGSDEKQAVAGTFVYMPARLEHALRAKTETVMLLVMLK